jgi:predicted nucleic-acid-binding protein
VIGLDTNVLVRYIADDDAKQSPQATQLIESLSPDAPGFVTTVSVVELVWVMQTCYRMNRDAIAVALGQILRTKELVVQNAQVVWQALRLYASSNADFADCLIQRSAADAGCVEVYTFDRAAAKGCGMKLITE